MQEVRRVSRVGWAAGSPAQAPMSATPETEPSVGLPALLAAGVFALAALLSGSYKPAPGERVAVVLCGGNAELSSILV